MNNINKKQKNKLLLRKIKKRDLPKLYKIYCEPEINKWFGGKISFEQYKKNFKTFQKRIKNKKSIHQVILLNRAQIILGEVSLYNINYKNKSAKLLVIVDKKYWDKGIGFEASQYMMDVAFKKLKLNCLFSEINSRNKKSINLCKKLGFVINKINKKVINFDNQKCDEIVFNIVNTKYDKKYI